MVSMAIYHPRTSESGREVRSERDSGGDTFNSVLSDTDEDPNTTSTKKESLTYNYVNKKKIITVYVENSNTFDKS